MLAGLMHSARAASAPAYVAIPATALSTRTFGPKAISRMRLKSEIVSVGRCVDPFSQRREWDLKMTTAALEVLACIAGSQPGNVRLRLCHLTLIF